MKPFSYRTFPKRLPRLFWASILALSSVTTSLANQPPETHYQKGEAQNRVDSSEDVVYGLFRDGAYIFSAPLRINKQGLIIMAAGGAATGILMGYDRKISNSVQHSRDRELKNYLKDLGEDGGVESLGRSSGVMLTALGFFTAGFVSDRDRPKKVAFIIVESWVYNDTVTKLLKETIGRSRPVGEDPYDFDSFSGKSSMPSGHTSTAFTLASVIATEYDSVWVDTLAYGTAATVGFSRLYRDVHWASDVLVSAILGIAIGKATHRLYDENPRNWKIILTGTGAKVEKRF